MTNSKETLREILLGMGRLEGKVDAMSSTQDKMHHTVKEMDTRLRQVEKNAVFSGGLSGGAVSIGISLFIESMKVSSMGQ